MSVNEPINTVNGNINDQYLVACQNYGCKPNVCVQKALTSGILDVSKDYLGSKGCKAVVDVISHMTLRRLDLSNNGLNTEIAIQLGKLMQTMLSLEWVNLSGNCLIMPPAGPVLCSTVSQNKSIHYMNLKGTRISETTIMKIESCCTRNRSTSVTEAPNVQENILNTKVDCECQTEISTSEKEIQTSTEDEEVIEPEVAEAEVSQSSSSNNAVNLKVQTPPNTTVPKSQTAKASSSTTPTKSDYSSLHDAIRTSKDHGINVLETLAGYRDKRDLETLLSSGNDVCPSLLITSCYYGKDKIVPLLIKHGARTDLQWYKLDAEQWARNMGHRRLAYQLRKLQVTITPKPEETITLKRPSFSKLNRTHPIYNIGTDVIINIFHYVPQSSLVTASLTCLQWMEIITEAKLLLKCGRVRNQPVDEVWAEELEDVLDDVNFFPYKNKS